MSIKGRVVWDLSEFTAALRKVPEAVRTAAMVTLNHVGDRCEEAVRRNAPVDTGAMRDSTRKEGPFEEGDALYVNIAVGGSQYTNPRTGGPVDYARHVEEGTARSRAQPFLLPGLLEGVRGIEPYFTRAFERLMK